MKMLKKIIAIALMGTSLFSLCGCKYGEGYPEYESGFFKYAVKTEKDGTQKAYILGLTESGLEQTVLVYPEEIEGVPVYGIGYEIQLINGTEPVGDFYGPKLEKLFYPTMPKETITGNLNFSFNGYSVYWNSGNSPGNGNGAIYGYNFYCSKIKQKPIYNDCNRIANVTYLYNYNVSPNEGYYWVDSYNESVITFIPPDPQHEGYKFDGWYKEVECINEWNFSTDITGKEIVLEPNKTYDTYEGIYLYAKWIAE